MAIGFSASGITDFLKEFRGATAELGRTATDLVATTRYVQNFNAASKDADALAVSSRGTGNAFTPVFAAERQAELDAVTTGSVLVGGKRLPTVLLLAGFALAAFVAIKMIR